MKVGDRVKLNYPLKDGVGTIIDILQPNVEYPECHIDKYYGANFPNKLPRCVPFERLIIKRDSGVGYVVVPLLSKTKSIVTLL